MALGGDIADDFKPTVMLAAEQGISYVPSLHAAVNSMEKRRQNLEKMGVTKVGDIDVDGFEEGDYEEYATMVNDTTERYVESALGGLSDEEKEEAVRTIKNLYRCEEDAHSKEKEQKELAEKKKAEEEEEKRRNAERMSLLEQQNAALQAQNAKMMEQMSAMMEMMKTLKSTE